jgi:hypothetical protein
MEIVATRDIDIDVIGVNHHWNEGDVINVGDNPDRGDSWYNNGIYHMVVGHGSTWKVEGFEPVEEN